MDAQMTTKVIWNVKLVAQPQGLIDASERPDGFGNSWSRALTTSLHIQLPQNSALMIVWQSTQFVG